MFFLFSFSFQLILIISIMANSNFHSALAVFPKPQLIGVDMFGYYTSIPQKRDFSYVLPENYYDDSFRLISEAGMNHIRYVYFWESYIKNPIAFLKEIEYVASIADKYGIKVIYDNHQYHTSSWLDPQKGTGFPSFLFQNSTRFAFGSGGSSNYPAATSWWEDWWDRKVIDFNGTDGWTLLAQFMKRIVHAVEFIQVLLDTKY